MEKRLYEEGYKLKENEFLLKIESAGRSRSGVRTGFLTKMTQAGRMPTSFANWGNNSYSNVSKEPMPIYVVEETYRTGWKLLDSRIGQSQQWIVMRHPDKYTVEIYLDDFVELVKSNQLINGELIGEFKWENHTLKKKA